MNVTFTNFLFFVKMHTHWNVKWTKKFSIHFSTSDSVFIYFWKKTELKLAMQILHFHGLSDIFVIKKKSISYKICWFVEIVLHWVLIFFHRAKGQGSEWGVTISLDNSLLLGLRRYLELENCGHNFEKFYLIRSYVS